MFADLSLMSEQDFIKRMCEVKRFTDAFEDAKDTENGAVSATRFVVVRRALQSE